MTYDGRSPDDLPLAAYGGRGMDPAPEDETRIEAAPPPPEVDPARDHVPPGPFAHAQRGTAMSADDPGERRSEAPRSLPPAVDSVVRTLRTSRVAAGGAFVGVILVGLVVLAGGEGPGAAGATASPSAAPVVVVTPEPGGATLVLSGKVDRSLTFVGTTGAGAPGAPLAVTWTDAALNSLVLEAAPDRGVRTTSETVVLRFTILVGEAPVTFTSDDGECTIGMALHPRNVSGTFSCKNLRSDDGKLTVGATGTYRT